MMDERQHRPPDEVLEAHSAFPEQYLISLQDILVRKKFGQDFLDEQDDITVQRVEEDFPDEHPLVQIGKSSHYDLEDIRGYRTRIEEIDSVEELELFAQADNFPFTEDDKKEAKALARDLVYSEYFKTKP